MKISDRWKFGVWALTIGSLTIIGAILVVSWVWPDEATRSGALTAVVGAISALVGAYFGVQVGGTEANAQKDAADAARQSAEHERTRADQAERHKTAALQTVATLMRSPQDARAMERLNGRLEQT
jgi:hypothetical protein